MHHTVPFLTLLVLLPAVGAGVLALLGFDRRLPREIPYVIALVTSLVTLGFAVAALVAMKVHDGGFQLVSDHEYTGSSLGVHWYLGIDGISLFLVLLTAVLFPLTIVVGRNRDNARVYFAWILLLEAAVMGSFLSLDLLVFFFMFELTLVPAYFIIAGWGHQRRAYAAVKFFLYTFLGSAFLLVGILALAFLHQSQYHYLTFSLGPLMQTHLTGTEGVLLFLAFTVRLRRQSAVVPPPHLVARRLHRGARGGLRRALGRPGQAGHLRHHPLRPQPVPAGHTDAGSAGPHLGRDRHRLRRRGGLRPARHEASGGLLVAGPDRLHRPRDHRAEFARAWPAACS